MLTFHVQDMTCGHCIKAITQAVQEVDPSATLEFNLPDHEVRITSVTADAHALHAAMESAGYTPELSRTAVPKAAGKSCGSSSGHCGCGCG
jgi:copper chaperone